MKKGYSHVTFVLDNSGSMAHLKKDTIGGYNEFIKKQKADPGSMTFSLYQFLPNNINGVVSPISLKPVIYQNGIRFDNLSSVNVKPIETPSKLSVLSSYEFVDIKNIPELNDETYSCMSGTPLLDAIGYAIHQTGVKLARQSEAERPETVTFVILTDGEELISTAYTKPLINEMIKRQTEVYNWEFIFLGANQDAIQAGASYGIGLASSMNYTASPAGVGATYSTLTETVSTRKAYGGKVEFSDVQRKAVMDGDKS